MTPPKFDSLAGAERQKAESRAQYRRSTAPKPTYTPPSAPAKSKPIRIDEKDRTIRRLRDELSRERWVNRYDRQRRFYGSYSWYRNPPAVVYYHDPYSNYFWWWLLAQDLNTRASWAYHHRYQMDEARYRDLLAKDAQLAARVKQLEEEKRQRDPTWVPEPIEKQGRDLMYRDGYVDAVYNPQPQPQVMPPVAVHYSRSAAGGGVLCFLFVLAFCGFMIWLVFFKRWGGT